MRLSRWFPVAAVVLVLAGAPPGQAQDIPDEATRDRVADWIERCDGDWSGACGRVDDYITERVLGRWCRRLEAHWDTPRLVRSADVDHPAADVADRHRHRAQEFLEECVPIYAAALARAGTAASDRADAGGGDPRDDGPRWEVTPADRVMQAAKRSNLRSGPGTEHDKVGLLEVGEQIRVTGEVGDWLRIEAPGGGEAFIYGPLLAEAAPDRAATASGDEPAPSPDTVAETEAVQAQDIPDAATGERVADWIERCNAWSPDATPDCKPVADQIMASELGRRCTLLRDAALGLSGDRAGQVLRDPERALSAMALRPDTVRRDVEEFLRDCVPIYAAALDKAGEEVGSSPGQATARAGPAAPQGARERVADWWERCWELRDGALAHRAWWYDLDDLSSDRDAQELVRMLQEDGRPVREAREYADNCGWAFEQARESDQRCDHLMRRVKKTGFRDGVLRNPEVYVDGATRRAIEEFRQNCVKVYDAVLDAGRRDTTAQTARSDRKPGQQGAARQDARTAGTDTGSTGPLHGSIAFSQDDDGAYAWGIAWSFDSAAGAQSEALAQCREYGGTQCAQAGWFQEACGALAIGSVNGYGTGWGATITEAERDALAQCRAVNDDCRIEVARCSQSEQAGGSGQLDNEDTAVSRDTAGTSDVLAARCNTLWSSLTSSFDLIDQRELRTRERLRELGADRELNRVYPSTAAAAREFAESCIDYCQGEVARCYQSEQAGGSGQLDSEDTAGTSDASCGMWEATYTVVWNEQGLRQGGENFSDVARYKTKAEAEDLGQAKCNGWGDANFGPLLESCVVSEAKCVQPLGQSTDSDQSAAVSLEPECTKNVDPLDGPMNCWMELSNPPGCRFWIKYLDIPKHANSITWSSSCSAGVADGEGVLTYLTFGETISRDAGVFSDGIRQGRWTNTGETFYSIRRFEGEYLNGSRHGTWLRAEETTSDCLVRDEVYSHGVPQPINYEGWRDC